MLSTRQIESFRKSLPDLGSEGQLFNRQLCDAYHVNEIISVGRRIVENVVSKHEAKEEMVNSGCDEQVRFGPKFDKLKGVE